MYYLTIALLWNPPFVSRRGVRILGKEEVPVTTVPQIFIDAIPVGGFQELQQLEAAGQLDRLLLLEE